MTNRPLHLPLRLTGAAALLVWLAGAFLPPAAAAASKDEDALIEGCDWLERAMAREPARDDSFGMFMRGMKPKCQAMLEGLARKDNSVRPDAVQQIVKEIADLRSIIDAEQGGPPPATTGPTPAERARQKIEDERAEKDKAASDKAAAEKAATDQAAAEKAAAEKEAADKAAAQKAEEEAKKAAERDAKVLTAAEKKAAEEAKKLAEREAREQAAAEKKAAEEAKKAAERDAKVQAAADKKAAEEAKKLAEREAKERAAAEKLAAEEAKKAAERDSKARTAAEQEAIKLKAQALVDAELEAEKKRAEEEAKARTPVPAPAKAAAPKAGGSGLDGTWEQPETKVLDRRVKRTLNLLTKDKKVQGELFEEVWFAAPSSWIDKSCGGNETFRMVTTARVNGEIDGKRVELWRDPPRVLTCTCSSRCTVESRRRGMDLAIGASGGELSDQTGVFVRPGAAVQTAGAQEGVAPAPLLATVDFAGNWETAPFSQRDRNIVQRLELRVSADGIVSGLLVERSVQDFPLANWSERFCEGASKWEWVTQWKLEGKVNGRKAGIKAKDGENLLCNCPSKCTPPKDKLGFDLNFGATGVTLRMGDRTFERR